MARIVFENEAIQLDGWMKKKARFGELDIILGLSDQAQGASAEFLPNKVLLGEKILWVFDKAFANCSAFLREVAGVPVIVYASKQELVEVIYLDEIKTGFLGMGNYAWKRSALDRLSMKLELAEQMKLEPRLSKIEQVLRARVDEQRRLKAEAVAAKLREQQRAQHEAKFAARQQRLAAIKARGHITVTGPNGQTATGYPVVGDEWQSFGNGVDCVLVTSWSLETGAVGPQEAFFVKVSAGGKKAKARVVAPVTMAAKAGRVAVPTGPVPQATLLVDLGTDDLQEVLAFEQADLRQLMDGGLNSGTVLARWPMPDNGSDRQVDLVIFEKGTMRDLKRVPVLAEERP